MKTRATQLTVAAIAVLAFCAAMATTSMAARGQDANGESATIAAHVPLPGPSATQMLLQRQEGKVYLYVEQGRNPNVAVVDVTNPSRPSLIQHVTWPSRLVDSQVQPLGAGLALAESPEGQVTSRGSSSRPQKVDIMDMTDPAHPQVLETIDRVTSILPDTARNLIFIANPQGLWIVRHRVGQRAYVMRHQCTSEAALNPEPDCY
jgi:hypothetical protein